MKNFKNFAWFALAAGLFLPGASTLRAADWRDTRSDVRDLRNDHSAVDRLRAEIARDEWRLNEDIRYGRRSAIRQDRRELERDQRALEALMRDIRHDRADLYRDRNDYRRR